MNDDPREELTMVETLIAYHARERDTAARHGSRLTLDVHILRLQALERASKDLHVIIDKH